VSSLVASTWRSPRPALASSNPPRQPQTGSCQTPRRLRPSAPPRPAFAQAELEAATAEGAELRRRSELAARVAATAAAWTLREALLESAQLMARAEERAILVVADSERESAALIDRAEQLRSAIATLEASAASLAAMTATNASVIDLSEIEALETADLDMAAFDAPPVNAVPFDSKRHDREEEGEEDDPVAVRCSARAHVSSPLPRRPPSSTSRRTIMRLEPCERALATSDRLSRRTTNEQQVSRCPSE
jgi:hypothetical protein